MKETNETKASIERAQRQLKELTFYFGSSFANKYRHRIDTCCEEIFQSLEQDNEFALVRAKSNLRKILNELSLEIKLAYEDDSDDFLEQIRKLS